VEIEGDATYVLRADLDELAGTSPTAAVRLLPGYDQWGPRARHGRPARRATGKASARQPAGEHRDRGRRRLGTWSIKRDTVEVAWFPEAGSPPQDALAEETARLATILDRPFEVSVQKV
jgi:hypothetical protein